MTQTCGLLSMLPRASALLIVPCGAHVRSPQPMSQISRVPNAVQMNAPKSSSECGNQKLTTRRKEKLMLQHESLNATMALMMTGGLG